MPDETQPLLHATVLATMLLEALERMSDPVASDEFMTELRDLCERTRAQLAAARTID